MKIFKIQGLMVTIFFSSVCYIETSLAQTNQTPTIPSQTSPAPMQPIAPTTTVPQKNVSQPATTPNSQTAETLWQYTGPNGVEKWGTLSPEFAACVNGQSQSPININPSETLPNAQNRLQVNYIAAPLEIVEDALSTYRIGTQTVKVNDGQSVQLNFPEPKETIVFNGGTYHLEQLHFHTPAENHLNGRQFPAELHLVNQGSNGRLAVIGVFIKAGEKNPVLERILANLPKEKNQIMKINDVYVNPADLLPANKSHYTFLGSLTTPPCTEGVEWIVMEQPIEASASQLQRLRYAIDEDNTRPVQPLHGRRILHVTQ